VKNSKLFIISIGLAVLIGSKGHTVPSGEGEGQPIKAESCSAISKDSCPSSPFSPSSLMKENNATAEINRMKAMTKRAADTMNQVQKKVAKIVEAEKKIEANIWTSSKEPSKNSAH